MWALRGLGDGVLTTRWPARPDAWAQSGRGPATVALTRPAAASTLAELDGLCPTGAIGSAADGSIRLDQGRCVQCGRCVTERPDVFAWTGGPAVARLSRAALIAGDIEEDPAGLAALRASLRSRTSALRRSVHLRHVDAGSDGTEEWEILALLNPVYDVHRLGIFFTASPRHADILLVTGAGARGMTEPLRRTYDAMPEPKIVIAVGTDAVSGGLLAGSYATTGGIAGTVPVDVWLPGSPPAPFAILYALLLAVGRLPVAATRGPAAGGLATGAGGAS
jgi:Ni,Fe-hydrogenase III small subunit/ferredoxin